MTKDQSRWKADDLSFTEILYFFMLFPQTKSRDLTSLFVKGNLCLAIKTLLSCLNCLIYYREAQCQDGRAGGLCCINLLFDCSFLKWHSAWVLLYCCILTLLWVSGLPLSHGTCLQTFNGCFFFFLIILPVFQPAVKIQLGAETKRNRVYFSWASVCFL